MRNKLQKYLKTLADRVFFQLAPEDAEFPYVIYDFTSSAVSGEYDEFLLVDISAWDFPDDGDTTTVEELISVINEGMDKHVLDLDGDFAVFFLNTKVYVQDKDNRLKRRTYTYETNIFRRG